MRRFLAILLAALPAFTAWTAESIQVPTAAVLPFEARTRSGEMNADGKSVAELLSIALMESGAAELVERAELDKAMDELQLSAIGMTDKASQLKLGKLVGAKILITGSMFRSGSKNYLVAKVIGTETSRVLGSSTSGNSDFADMINELAPKISAVIEKHKEKLLPESQTVQTVCQRLKNTVQGNQRKVFVTVKEDILVAVPDPAAETELKKLLLALGFQIADTADGADFVLRGEALASQAGNFHKFTSAAARMELSVYGKNKKLLATGAAKETLAGASYVIAAKDAIGQAALSLASQLLGCLK